MTKSKDIITDHKDVKAVRNGDEYRVYFPYSPEAVLEIKSLPRKARRFDSIGESKFWIVPASKIRTLKKIMVRIAEIAIDNDADQAGRSAAIVDGVREIVLDAASTAPVGYVGSIDGQIVRVRYVGPVREPRDSDVEKLNLECDVDGIYPRVCDVFVTDATAAEIVIYQEEKAEIASEQASAQR